MVEPQDRRPPHIEENWSQERLDGILRGYYGFALFDFALSLAIIFRRNPPFRLYNIWRLKQGTLEILENYRGKVIRLKRTRALIVRRLSGHLEDIGYWRSIVDGVEDRLFPSIFPVERIHRPQDGELSVEDKARIVKNLYRLEGLEKLIDAELSHYDSLIRLYSIGGPGRPALAKTIISSLWSCVLKWEGRLNADAIVELLNWFLVRLRNTEYGRTFEQTLSEGYPTSEDMSRFRRRFETELREDLVQIFHNNYLENPGIETTRVLGIRFDFDEPRFFRIEEAEDTELSSILFPSGVRAPEGTAS